MSKHEDETSEPRRVAGSVPMPKMRRGLRSFYNDVIREMRHVHWPARREVNRLTGVVLMVCFMTVVILTVLSVAFDTLFKAIFRGA